MQVLSNGKHAVKSKPTVQRETFKTSRQMEFCTRKELTTQTGHEPGEWQQVILKELVDNSLDACEEAGIPPEILVRVDETGIEVSDNGPGIPESTVDSILDFTVRVSSREAWMSPDRGAQGNATKTIVPMPFVLFGEGKGVTIRARGIEHRIQIHVDQIRQIPVVNHQKTPAAGAGTMIRVDWDSARSIDDSEGDEFLQDDVNGDDSPCPLEESKDRFLQMAAGYAVLNPHLKLRVEWFGEIVEYTATDTAWKKWTPSEPTCPHWYKLKHLERLISACVAYDQDHDTDRTVREFIATFRGITATAKQKAILEATGLGRAKLSELVTDRGLDKVKVESILNAMKSQSKPVKPRQLGVIGKDHFAARFKAMGAAMESFQYRKVEEVTDGVPWVAEVVFVWMGKRSINKRRIITGFNWSPGITNPFRELGRYGRSLDDLLREQRASADEPIVFVMHIVCPRVEFKDRGKSSVVITERGKEAKSGRK